MKGQVMYGIFFIANELLKGMYALNLGSQRDDHGCSLDGGYQWCESTSQCQRAWETPCPSSLIDMNGYTIPEGCVSWYDGCNTCRIMSHRLLGCTRMMCIESNTPFCRSYSDGH